MIVLGAGLLQACIAPPAIKKEMAMEPLLRVRHSSEQTAATYYQLGKYHQERGSLDLARDSYKHSLSLDKRQLDARNALATIYSQQGKLDEAKALLLELIAEYPLVAHPYNNLGYVYFIEGNYEAAVKTLKHALIFDKKNERTLNNLHAAELAQARVDEAVTPVAKGAGDISVAVAVAVVVDTEPALVDIGNATKTTQIKAISLVTVPDEVKSASKDATLQMTLLEEKKRVELTPLLTSSSANSLDLEITAPANSTTAKQARVEVSNGNGVSGMAKWMGGFLGRQGIAVSRLTNEHPFTREITKIQYQAGFKESAQALQQALHGDAQLMPINQATDRIDVRLVLGQDAIAKIAKITQSEQANRATRATLLALKSR